MESGDSDVPLYQYAHVQTIISNVDFETELTEEILQAPPSLEPVSTSGGVGGDKEDKLEAKDLEQDLAATLPQDEAWRLVTVKIDETREKELTEDSIVQCQAYIRRYLACLEVQRRREAEEEDRQQMEETVRDAQIEEGKQRALEVSRRTNPQNARDFQILYDELAAWVKGELLKIDDKQLARPYRMAALSELLERETEILQQIDRLKSKKYKERSDIRFRRMLAKLAEPEEWKCGLTHTPITLRARDVALLYFEFTNPSPDLDTRLDSLLRTKWAVKALDSPEAEEMCGLIDREADLLYRGRSPGSLKVLRKRSSFLLSEISKDPAFNPAIRSVIEDKLDHWSKEDYVKAFLDATEEKEEVFVEGRGVMINRGTEYKEIIV
ncbi:IQ and ubiquitin-like domain-containing protein like protein [Aduncisulcus paluster]|uniref:IQ and ubiquitin-like domain-containing protein like protein n=1 Tax=Aduncisulcus paluster TaxID=2918883 RepID=A0ABQ5KSQ4_9EUKA|nr:IQ and ubiquitin-like domain-containing protein like protein [Aduncisulcus paluster]